MAKLEDIEGVGAKYAEKLRAAGVRSTDGLLSAAGSKKGRQSLAEKTGIGDALILEWVNHADLFRIKGVGSEFADLLEEAGVDSVPELARRSPASLCKKMAEANAAKKLVRQLPTEAQVAGWVEQAKGLPRVVTH